MSVNVRIPSALRQYTGGESTISVSADTVGAAFDRAVDQHPDLAQHIYDDDGELRNFVNAYLNEEDIRDLEGNETSVSDGDTIVIVPSIAGGRGAVPPQRGAAPRGGRT